MKIIDHTELHNLKHELMIFVDKKIVAGIKKGYTQETAMNNQRELYDLIQKYF